MRNAGFTSEDIQNTRSTIRYLGENKRRLGAVERVRTLPDRIKVRVSTSTDGNAFAPMAVVVGS